MFPLYREPKVGRQGGFTLVELLVVAAILLILAVIALPVYARMTDKTRITVGQTRIKEIEKALEQYRAANGYYPSRLGVLVDVGNVRPEVLETPWSTEDRRLYYFYAVDEVPPKRALGYALGDPGPKPTRGCSGQNSTTLPNTGPLPCGRDPNVTTWHFGTNFTLDATACRDDVNTGLFTYYTLSGCRDDLTYER
ncbi:MAG TPA: type II secretion system protein [Symbiobacteriaceae bacterium]|nr:type II secretion system protein [Symbiobacteriaceae bacterium]